MTEEQVNKGRELLSEIQHTDKLIDQLNGSQSVGIAISSPGAPIQSYQYVTRESKTLDVIIEALIQHLTDLKDKLKRL